VHGPPRSAEWGENETFRRNRLPADQLQSIRGVGMLTTIGRLRALCLVLFLVASYSLQAQPAGRIMELKGKVPSVGINADGPSSISQSGMPGTVMRSDVEADADSKLLRSLEYPQHKTVQSEFH